MLWIITACALLPSAFADMVAIPPGQAIGAGIFVIVLMLIANYTINFAITVPVAKTISHAKIGKIAKGLLIITPISLQHDKLGFILDDVLSGNIHMLFHSRRKNMGDDREAGICSFGNHGSSNKPSILGLCNVLLLLVTFL